MIKHCANTSGTTRDVMSRTDLERMRTITVGQTRGTYEEHIREDSQDRKRARSPSKRKVERPSNYCEREEFYEAAAPWNMQGRSYRNPDYYAFDAEDQVVLRQGAEFLSPQHVWKVGSGTRGLEIFRGV